MKKNVLRIFATASAVVATALVIVLLVTTFGGINAEDYDNSLVKGLIMAMSIAYLALTVVTIIMLFVSDEATKEITLRMGQEGNTRITVGVIKKIAKEKAALIEGVKCKKCVLITNEYGVRLKLSVSIKGKDAEDAENELRAILIDAYDKILGFKFHSIELKVKKLVPAYTTDVPAVISKAHEDAEAAKAAKKAAAEKDEEAVAVEEIVENVEAVEEVVEDASVGNEETAESEVVEEAVAEEAIAEEAVEETAEEVAAEEEIVEEEQPEVFEENGILQ